MKQFCLILFLLFFVIISFGQKKEKAFYSYIQQKITELNGTDSVVIDQFSNQNEKYNWQAVIKASGDSCLVIFLPPQYSQDSMVFGELKPINVYKTSRAILLSAFEQAKKNLKQDRSKVKVEISVGYQKKVKEFRLLKVQELYYRLRYNKSPIHPDE